MGDRAQVVVGCGGPASETGEHVYLYTHWGGSALIDDVLRALRRRQRWDDAGYLARIVFCEMMVGPKRRLENVLNETGFGIDWLRHADIEHPLIWLDAAGQELWVAHARWKFTAALDPELVNEIRAQYGVDEAEEPPPAPAEDAAPEGAPASAGHADGIAGILALLVGGDDVRLSLRGLGGSLRAGRLPDAADKFESLAGDAEWLARSARGMAALLRAGA